jgi:hypothetical protein
MLTEKLEQAQIDNHALKNEEVELISENRSSARADISLEQLEKIRTGGPSVPASKHGLEAICGGSCDTAAT